MARRKSSMSKSRKHSRRKTRPKRKVNRGLSDKKKRTIGAFVIVAIVAFAAIVLTQYLVVIEVDVTMTAAVAIIISLSLLLIKEVQANRKLWKRRR